MGIPPDRIVFSAVKISVCDVHAADISYGSVDDHKFPVVAPVDAVCKLRECNPEKGVDIDSGPAHLLEKACTGGETSHMIVDHQHFHPLSGLVNENLGNLVSEIVVGKDVVLEKYRLAGGFEIFFQSLEFRDSVRENLDIVVYRELGLGKCVGQHDQLLAVGRDVHIPEIDGSC